MSIVLCICAVLITLAVLIVALTYATTKLAGVIIRIECHEIWKRDNQ